MSRSGRTAALLLGVIGLVATGCHTSNDASAATCMPGSGAVQTWPAGGPTSTGTPLARLSAFGGMTGGTADVVSVGHDRVVDAEGLRGGTYRAVLTEPAAARLARCIDAPAYARVAGSYGGESGQTTSGKFCSVADGLNISVATDGLAGQKKVTAYALDLEVGAYGTSTPKPCGYGYPAALRALAAGLYSLRAQVEAHGKRVG